MYRIFRISLMVAVATLVGIATLPAQTAASAVAVLQKQYGKVYGGRLVAITGQKGQHQPKDWHLFAYDLQRPALVSHFVVRGGKIVTAAMLDERRSQAWAAPVLGWDKVKISSEEAFKIADGTARAAAVGFDSLDYRLMNDRTTGSPVYQLELKDSRGLVVGNLKVDAVRGRVLSQSWPGKPGAGGIWNGQDKIDWQIVKEEMGKVGRDIGTVFRDLGNNVRSRFQR